MTTTTLFACSCTENCKTHVRVESNLTLTTSCTDNCWSPAGPTLVYDWKLFIGGTSLSDPFVEVPLTNSIAIGKYRCLLIIIIIIIIVSLVVGKLPVDWSPRRDVSAVSLVRRTVHYPYFTVQIQQSSLFCLKVKG